jgi:hypothetical protein
MPKLPGWNLSGFGHSVNTELTLKTAHTVVCKSSGRNTGANIGFYTSADGSKYPRLQLLTIKGLIEGTQHLQRPLHVRDVTFKKAPRSRPEAQQNLTLPLGDE